ncbi:MAG: aldo/keto reductase [Deltaproteobacteria bacterium]|nr:aldo/keto reductase [Deltaproteobacteria bacterium]
MRKVTLGRTNLEVTHWGLGGIGLSTIMGGGSEEAIRAVIHAALDYGINLIDTSRVYMDSETLIGEVMKTRRSEAVIASKTITRDRDGAMADLEESLTQLQTDKIEIYQLHAVKPHDIELVMGKDGALQALKEARDQGLIDFIGLTSHHVDVMVQLIKTGEFDTVMFPFNVIERNPAKELLPLAQSLNVGTFVMKPLGGGAIENRGDCFRFLNSYPVDVIFNGVSNVAEFNENMPLAENIAPLSTEELAAFEKEVAVLGQDFCRRCSYCEPCPSDIHIPDMIHVFYQNIQGMTYDELPPEKQAMGKNLLIWLEACEECGQCEERCPYSLPTIKRKQEMVAMFSGK